MEIDVLKQIGENIGSDALCTLTIQRHDEDFNLLITVFLTYWTQIRTLQLIYVRFESSGLDHVAHNLRELNTLEIQALQ